MKWMMALAASLLLSAVASSSSYAAESTATDLASVDEFVGPLPGWKNVRADYGAVGDGKTDDTAAIQKALDDLRFHKDFNVLYFPAGTYRITGTVKTLRKSHQEGMGITIVGEDPATTIIRWDGPEKGMMVKYDAWFSKISRLTLDGVGKAGTALAYGDAFSTYNETSDMVFKDVATGLAMATGDFGQAENAVLRCKFLRCKEVGLRTNSFNSLDIWAWYCLFEDCGIGLYNGSGNFHVYQCLFLRSKRMDIGIANLMVFSIVNNTSIGSHSFMDWGSQHTWGAPTSITGNRIIEPTNEFAIRLGNAGPYLVMDNVIKARPDTDKPLVDMTWGDQAFIGNTYSVSVDRAVHEAGRFIRFDEKTVAPESIDVSAPKLPATPPNRKRQIFSVAKGADTQAIQDAIDRAAKLKGQRPVVHLASGMYQLKSSLVVPAGCDLQIVGDGSMETATALSWQGPAGEPLLKLQGPSHVTLRDFAIHTGAGVGIRLENCDQQGGRIFTDQLNTSGNAPSHKGRTGLRIDGVDHTDVQLRCAQGGASLETWLHVVGGSARASGSRAGGQISVFTGASSTAVHQYAVEKGARLLVRGVYHEMSDVEPQAIKLVDRGSLSVDSTRFSYKTSADQPLVLVDNYQGEFSLLSSLLLPVASTHTARMVTKGNGKATKFLCMSNTFWVNEPQVTTDKVWLNKADPAATAAFLLCTTNGGPPNLEKGSATLEPSGDADPDFIRNMVGMIREGRIWLPGGVSNAGVTNVQIHRVIINVGKDGVGAEFLAAPN